MKHYRLENYTKGWIVGDFDPSLLRTGVCEVSIKYYKAGDHETPHTHKLADELTVIVSGSFLINGVTYGPSDIVHAERNDVMDFSCLEDGATTVVKYPSVAGDKYLSADEKAR
jgi:hypothetical protein